MADDHTHAKAADDLRKGKYTTGPPDGFIVGTDRTECCIWCCRSNAGWVTYFQKEQGAPGGGGAGAETEDNEEGATPAQSDVQGSYVRLTAAAFAGRQCECAAVARTAAAGRLSGMKTEPKNA